MPARSIHGLGSYNFLGLDNVGSPLMGYGIPMYTLLGGPNRTSKWDESVTSYWRGDYTAANGATYQVSQSYNGTDWWTTSYTEAEAADGTRTGTNERHFANDYRSDAIESDRLANLLPVPAAGTAPGPVTQNEPTDMTAAVPAGTVYLSRTFSAGHQDGYNTAKVVTSAAGLHLRSPEVGRTDWNGNSANRYYFSNTHKVGDRTDAAKPAEDRYSWLIDYQDTGEYHGTQEKDFPNEGTVPRSGTQTTDGHQSQTVSSDTYKFTQATHRANDGNLYDGTTQWNRRVAKPIVSTTDGHTEESWNSAGVPATSSAVTVEVAGEYQTTATNAATGTEIRRNSAGVREGATVSSTYSLTVSADHMAEGEEKNKTTATITAGLATVTVQGHSASGSTFSTLMRTASEYTADGNGGTVKTLGVVVASGESHDAKDINGTFKDGKQRTGTLAAHSDSKNESHTLVNWKEVQGPDIPKTVTNQTADGKTVEHWDTVFYLRGRPGERHLCRREPADGQGKEVEHVRRRSDGLGGVAQSEGRLGWRRAKWDGRLVRNLTDFEMTPTRLTVNDRERLVLGTSEQKTEVDLVLIDGKKSGTVNSRDDRMDDTESAISHLATRPDDELKITSRVDGRVKNEKSVQVLTTYVADEATRQKTEWDDQLEDVGHTMTAKGHVIRASAYQIALFFRRNLTASE